MSDHDSRAAATARNRSISALREIARSFVRIQRTAFSCIEEQSESECLVLIELLVSDGLSITELATRTASDPPWMSRTVERLRQAGLVERSENPRDRRQNRIRLTRTGATNATRLNQELNRQSERLLRKFSLRERREVLDDLARLAGFLNELAQPIHGRVRDRSRGALD